MEELWMDFWYWALEWSINSSIFEQILCTVLVTVAIGAIFYIGFKVKKLLWKWYHL